MRAPEAHTNYNQEDPGPASMPHGPGQSLSWNGGHILILHGWHIRVPFDRLVVMSEEYVICTKQLLCRVTL